MNKMFGKKKAGSEQSLDMMDPGNSNVTVSDITSQDSALAGYVPKHEVETPQMLIGDIFQSIESTIDKSLKRMSEYMTEYPLEIFDRNDELINLRTDLMHHQVDFYRMHASCVTDDIRSDKIKILKFLKRDIRDLNLSIDDYRYEPDEHYRNLKVKLIFTASMLNCYKSILEECLDAQPEDSVVEASESSEI